ncbi:kelch-like protein 11 [Glandiceps talaboti]
MAVEHTKRATGERLKAVSSHHALLIGQLKEQKDSEVLCDMTLTVGGQQFKAHRCVLAACSPYFESLFRSDMQEAHRGNVELQCTTAVGMKVILNYMYSGELQLTFGNVYDIISGADHLMMTALKEFCGQFLVENLSPSNVFKGKGVAVLYDFPGLQEVADDMIVNKFSQVLFAVESQLLELPPDELVSLISNEKLRVKNEDDLLDLVLKWTNYNKSERKDMFPELLRHIWFEDITEEFYLRNFLTEPLVVDNPACKEFLPEGIILPERRSRRPGRLVDVIAVSNDDSSQNGNNSNDFLGYVVEEDRWVHLPDRKTSASSCKVYTDMENKVFHSSECFKNCSVDVFDPMKNSWFTYYDKPRYSNTFFNFNGQMYALGRKLHVYDVRENSWIKKQHPGIQLKYTDATVVAGRYVYAIRGPYTNYIGVYDTKYDIWTSLSSEEMTRMTKDQTRQIYNPIVMKRGSHIEVTCLGKYKVVISTDTHDVSLVDSDIPRMPDPPQQYFIYGAGVCCTSSGDIFICGGLVKKSLSEHVCMPKAIKTTYMLSHCTNTWKTLAPLPRRVDSALCTFIQMPYEYLTQ